MRGRLFHGWVVVAACFVQATFAWGLGFYGLGVYLVQLQGRAGWSAALVSSAITFYFFIGALLVALTGTLYERLGPRVLASLGACAFAVALTAMAHATARWQLFAAFAVLALGWGTTTSAAINMIVAPWFDRRRGLALSLALTGASVGGVIAPPLLVLAIERLGFARGVEGAGWAMAAIVVPLAWWAMVREPAALGLRRDCRDAPQAPRAPDAAQAPWSLGATLRAGPFWTIVIPFALGLTAQVAFLTHQVAILEPALTRSGAALGVSVTGAAAVIGRVISGALMDRLPRRTLAACNFALQCAALVLMAHGGSAWLLYATCALYGLGVGNLISFPGLLVHQEFSGAHFARITGLVVGICQLTYSSGPALLGALRAATGSYAAGLYACALALAASAVIVLRRRG
ncbi:MAG TPA: MFS transporter [Burkholderiales bacterium]|nr:MFS transporter [Burkholderiales bacterium]